MVYSCLFHCLLLQVVHFFYFTTYSKWCILPFYFTAYCSKWCILPICFLVIAKHGGLHCMQPPLVRVFFLFQFTPTHRRSSLTVSLLQPPIMCVYFLFHSLQSPVKFVFCFIVLAPSHVFLLSIPQLTASFNKFSLSISLNTSRP